MASSTSESGRSNVHALWGNGATRAPAFGPALDRTRAAEVVAPLLGALSAAPVAAGLARGYRLFWTRRDEVGWRDLPADPGAYVVLGRHEACDVALGRDPEISLRHVMARALVLADGSLALRLSDLRASLPMYLDDGVPRHALLASGAVAVRLGRYVIGGLPIEGGRVLPDAELALREAHVQESMAVPKADTRQDPMRSSIVSLPRISEISELGPPLGAIAAWLGVVHEGRAHEIGLTTPDLEAGVLVGRAERCLDRGLRSLMTEQISRAHLLVVRDGEAIAAFDLCSTNGTESEGAPARRVVLRDGSKLELAGRSGLVLTFRARTPEGPYR